MATSDLTEAAPQRPAYPTTRRAVTLSLAGKAAEAATLALLVTLVPRRLGPADYGTFAAVLALVTLGSTSLAFSGPAVMSRFVAAAAPEERAALARALALRALRWRAAGLVAVALAGVVLIVVDQDRFSPAATVLVVAAIAADVPATVAFQSALALGSVGAWSFRYPLQNLIMVLGALVLYRFAGLEGALAAVLVGSVGSLVAGVALVARPLRRAPSNAKVPRDVSRFAFLQGWSNLLVQVQHRGAVVAAALLAGSRTETGYAALAAGIAVAATYAVWQVFTVTLPRFAAVAVADPATGNASLRRLSGTTLVVAVPIAILVVAFAGPLLTLLGGHSFDGAERALAPALATLPLAPLTGAVGAASALGLKARERLWTVAAGAAVFIVAAVGLVPPYGAVGATGALLAGTGAAVLAGIVLFPRLVDVPRIAFSCLGCAAVLVIGLVR